MLPKWLPFSQGRRNSWYEYISCPYKLCPSNQPFMGALKPRMKFIQKPAPEVFQYLCKDCGCPTNFEMIKDLPINHPDRQQVKNPAFIGLKPSFAFKFKERLIRI